MVVTADFLKKKSVYAENSQVIVDISLIKVFGTIPADRQKRLR